MPKWLDGFLEWTVILSFTRFGYALRKSSWNPDDLDVDLSGKSYLVTGANSGLGFETSKQLAQRGATVHMLARSKERGEAAQAELKSLTGNTDIHLHIADISLLSEVSKFVDEFVQHHDQLDVLINNAGAMMSERKVTEEGHELTFATNLLGSFLLTQKLVPLLEQSTNGRIIFVSSGGMYTAKLRVHDLQNTKQPYKPAEAYAQTKRGQVMLTALFAEKLKDKNITVNSMHPGWVDTAGLEKGMPRFRRLMKRGLRNLQQGADTIVWLAVANRVKNETGKFWFDRRERSTHRFKSTQNSAEEYQRFWDECMRLSGLGEQ